MKFLLLFALVVMFACNQPGNSNDTKNIDNLKAAYEALNQRNWDAFAALCDENYTEVNVGPTPIVGIQKAIELYKQFFAGFPDFNIAINDIAPAGNNRYLLRVSITGTNTGEFMGIQPTGKPIKFDDADVVELNAEGKAVSHAITNAGEPMRQIGYGSMTNPNVQVIMAGYDKLGQGDIPGLLELHDDNVVFDIEEKAFDPKARIFKGKEGIGEFFKELGSKFKYTKFQPTRFLADGDDVIVLIDVEYEDLASHKNYSSTLMHHFKVVNGKVTYALALSDFPKQI